MMSHHFLHFYIPSHSKIRWRKACYRTASCPARPASPKTTLVPYLASVWRLPTSSTAKVSQTEARLWYWLTAVLLIEQVERRANASGQDSAVHLHLREENHSFEDNNVNILTREDRWFVRGVTESVYLKLKRPSLNRGGALRHYISPTDNAVLSFLPRHLTTIHIRAHLVLATHMKVGWVNDPQVTLMTVKLRSHMCP